MNNYLDLLNEEQKSAVLAGDGPVLVLAGAGSGKTRVLTSRIAYLMEQGVGSHEIMAVTFTNKAAGEMENRIYDMLGYAPSGMWIGTFHRICLRILRMDGEVMGIPHDFAIYDNTDQKSLIKAILKQRNIDTEEITPALILSVIGHAKTQMFNAESFMETAVTAKEELIAEVFVEYEKQLAQNGALDFDDLLNNAVELLSLYPEVLMKYKERFKYILVDEYQDTNEAQYRFLKLLAGVDGNLFVVGDPDQSIYAFRGAKIENILNFRRDYPKAQIYRLEINYRSTAQILNAANALISNNKGRMEKNLRPHDKSGKAVTAVVLPDEIGEARYVANTIERLIHDENYTYNDMAVFYRTHAQSRILEDLLMKHSIPYKVFGGQKFYERAEIKNTIAYLRLLVNPDDNVSLLRVINVPRRGIGNVTIEKLEALSLERGTSIWNVLETTLDDTNIWKSANSKKLKGFYDLILSLRKRLNDDSVTAITNAVWLESGYRESLEEQKTVENLSRLENMGEFLTVTSNFDEESKETGEVRGLAEFLSDISLSSDLDSMDDDDRAVTLMTIHMAKGLEFPIVFLVGMEENIFPHTRSIMSASEDDMEEERRICYVGVTRAMDELYLLRTYHRRLWGKTMANRCSRFIDEMGLAPILPQTPPVAVSAPNKEEIKPQSYDDSLALGDHVVHVKFGEGVIVSLNLEDERASVAFPDIGIKEFLLAYANLKKV